MTTSAEIALNTALAETPRERAVDVRDERRRVTFERLVREHAAVMHSIARRLVPHADAEDVLQEAFVKAWRGLSKFRREADMRTWLFRILVNACRDRQRRLRRPLPGRPEERFSRDPAQGSAQRELVDRVFRAVDTLPPRQRECILLRARAEMSYSEIGRLLGIGKGAVKSHLVQARRKLLVLVQDGSSR